MREETPVTATACGDDDDAACTVPAVAAAFAGAAFAACRRTAAVESCY